MRWPGRKRIAPALAWLRSRGRPRALILGYHRVGRRGPDPHRLSVSTSAFERQLDTLVKSARPVFLSELVEDVRTGVIEPRRVAVTFDDAYVDTLRLVEPLLRERDVPATVFVPTGLVGTEPWWDRLARILSGEGPLPGELVLPLGPDGPFRRQLTVAERAPAHGDDSRVGLTMAVYHALCTLPSSVRLAALDALDDWSGASESPVCDLVATSSELSQLNRSDVFEIGSHSVTHPFLPQLSVDDQRTEVEGSRQTLQELLGHPVDLFSYPNGAADQATDALLREAGYSGACRSRPGVATADSDPFALPRFWPDGDEECVARLLRRWL